MILGLKKNLIKPKISDLFLIVLSAVFLIVLFNFRTIYTDFLECVKDHKAASFIVVGLEIALAVSLIILVLLLTSLSKTLLKITLIITFVFSTIYFYVLNKFGIIVDEVIISNALNSLGHADEVMDYSIIFYFLFFAILPAFFVVRAEIYSSNYKKKIITITLCALIFAASHIFFKSERIVKITLIKYSPINYFDAVHDYLLHMHGQLEQSKSRVSLDQIYKFNHQKKVSDLNIVLVIGESLRADHLGLNGYYRNTTPQLEATKNLLNFVISTSFNTTTRSVTSMLSHRTKQEFVEIPPEKSIVDLLKKLGFKTYWYSSQSSKEFSNGMLNIMASEADESFFRERLQAQKGSSKIYDGDLLLYFNQAMQGSGSKFIVLHSFGSHIRFHERYPENFRIFTPECTLIPSACDVTGLVNSYDNTVMYTDYFLSEVIKSIQGTNTILFYASDHGLFLGENGVHANGNSNQQDEAIVKVPMFIYATDKLLKNSFYQKKFAAAHNKTSRKDLSHDNLFDSILECSGIESELLERGLSVCQK